MVTDYIQVGVKVAPDFHSAVVAMDPGLINKGRPDLHNKDKIVFSVLGDKRDPRLIEKLQEFSEKHREFAIFG